jgi:hypothetical protein
MGKDAELESEVEKSIAGRERRKIYRAESSDNQRFYEFGDEKRCRADGGRKFAGR